MRRITTICVAILCSSLALRPSRGASLTDYVDDKAIFAGEVDTRKLDFDAIEKWLVETMKTAEIYPTADQAGAEKDLHEGLSAGKQWIADFQKAGGTSLYSLVNGSSFGNNNPFAAIAPLAAGSNSNAIMSLFLNGTPSGPTTLPAVKGQQAQWERFRQRPELIGDKAVAFAVPTGLTWVKAIQPKDRPEVAAALKSAGDVPARLVLAPTPAFKAFMKQNVPPMVMGPSTAPLTQGIVWISSSVTMPPNPTGRLVIQAKDPQTAEAVKKLIAAGLALEKMYNQGKGVLNPEDVMLALPTVQNDQLVLELDNAKAVRLARQLAPMFREQRKQAIRVASSSHMRQILMGFVMYANDNKGDWPDKMEAIAKYVGGAKSDVFNNPSHPETKPAYVYIKPPSMKNIKNAWQVMVLYESHLKFEGVNCGFADGHVEYVADQKRFNDLLQAATESGADKDSGGL